MNIKEILEKPIDVQKIPESKRKTILWTTVVIISIVFFVFWLINAKEGVGVMIQEGSQFTSLFLKKISDQKPKNIQQQNLFLEINEKELEELKKIEETLVNTTSGVATNTTSTATTSNSTNSEK